MKGFELYRYDRDRVLHGVQIDEMECILGNRDGYIDGTQGTQGPPYYSPHTHMKQMKIGGIKKAKTEKGEII